MMQSVSLPATDARFTVTPPATSFDVAGPVRDGDAEVRKQAGRFIAGSFFAMMLRAMRETVPTDGLLSGGRGEQVFREFFDHELGERFSDGETLGLVEAAVRQLSGRAVYRQKMLRSENDPQLRRDAEVSMRDTNGASGVDADGGQR